MSKGSKKHQKKRRRHRRALLATGVLVGAMVLVMVLWTSRPPPQGRVGLTASGDRLHTVPAGQLPMFAASAPSSVQNVYRYAVDHPAVLRHIPCFCGCEKIGHRHNGDCYVQARHSDGTITFTSHGAT